MTKLDFQKHTLSLEEIINEGYTFVSSDDLHWFEKVDNNGVLIHKFYPPTWMSQLLNKVVNEALENNKKQMRRLLGFE